MSRGRDLGHDPGLDDGRGTRASGDCREDRLPGHSTDEVHVDEVRPRLEADQPQTRTAIAGDPAAAKRASVGSAPSTREGRLGGEEEAAVQAETVAAIARIPGDYPGSVAAHDRR